jgi:hypothetical protein
MGLFGKKKDEVSWETIQASMNAPKIPDDQPQWFVENKRSLLHTSFVQTSGAVIPSSWINVETAAISVANAIFPSCDDCESRETCKSCGRGGKNSITVSTADADGDYLVWETYNSAESFNKGVSDGFLVFFDPSVYATFQTGDQFSFTSQDLAPIYLGNVVPKDYARKTGMIHISDTIAAVDSDLFIAGARAKAEPHQVVAWVGYNIMGRLVPMAVSVTSSSYAGVFTEDTKVTSPVPADLKNEILNGDEVFARIGNNQEHFAQQNAEIYSDPESSLYFLTVSWFVQVRLSEDPEGLTKDILSEGASNALAALDALRIRGNKSFVSQCLDELEKKFAGKLTDRDKLLIQLIRKTPVGQFILEP